MFTSSERVYLVQFSFLLYVSNLFWSPLLHMSISFCSPFYCKSLSRWVLFYCTCLSRSVSFPFYCTCLSHCIHLYCTCLSYSVLLCIAHAYIILCRWLVSCLKSYWLTFTFKSEDNICMFCSGECNSWQTFCFDFFLHSLCVFLLYFLSAIHSFFSYSIFFILRFILSLFSSLFLFFCS